MEDIVGYAVAFIAIVAVYKWFTAPAPAPAGPSLGFTPKRITNDMVTQVQTMFPDQPYDNIKYDLLRTGSVELTCNKILEQGYLPRPTAAYYTLYPSQPLPNPSPSNPRPAAPQPTVAPSPQPNLISRFGLQNRVSTEKPDTTLSTEKSAWETTAEKREASLKERKAQMVLAARQRMLAQLSQKD
ncbi:hypothetical protein FRC03_008922 [Tulasnella sp. 419]|nr:hypothetical protein FRC03_008922 [Tulasnella sp. 419]